MQPFLPEGACGSVAFERDTLQLLPLSMYAGAQYYQPACEVT